jgi:hypothetical protein
MMEIPERCACARSSCSVLPALSACVNGGGIAATNGDCSPSVWGQRQGQRRTACAPMAPDQARGTRPVAVEIRQKYRLQIRFNHPFDNHLRQSSTVGTREAFAPPRLLTARAFQPFLGTSHHRFALGLHATEHGKALCAGHEIAYTGSGFAPDAAPTVYRTEALATIGAHL